MVVSVITSKLGQGKYALHPRTMIQGPVHSHCNLFPPRAGRYYCNKILVHLLFAICHPQDYVCVLLL
jgi:hypothetical protein